MCAWEKRWRKANRQASGNTATATDGMRGCKLSAAEVVEDGPGFIDEHDALDPVARRQAGVEERGGAGHQQPQRRGVAHRGQVEHDHVAGQVETGSGGAVFRKPDSDETTIEVQVEWGIVRHQLMDQMDIDWTSSSPLARIMYH
jgi:hypothetical protein